MGRCLRSHSNTFQLLHSSSLQSLEKFPCNWDRRTLLLWITGNNCFTFLFPYGREEIYIHGHGGGNLKESGQLSDLGKYRRIILKSIGQTYVVELNVFYILLMFFTSPVLLILYHFDYLRYVLKSTACEVSQTLPSAPCSQKLPICHAFDNCIISSSVIKVAFIKIWDRQTRNDTGRLKDTGQQTMGVGFISHPNNCSLVVGDVEGYKGFTGHLLLAQL